MKKKDSTHKSLHTVYKGAENLYKMLKKSIDEQDNEVFQNSLQFLHVTFFQNIYMQIELQIEREKTKESEKKMTEP